MVAISEQCQISAHEIPVYGPFDVGSHHWERHENFPSDVEDVMTVGTHANVVRIIQYPHPRNQHSNTGR
jgi:hypothetical protein